MIAIFDNHHSKSNHYLGFGFLFSTIYCLSLLFTSCSKQIPGGPGGNANVSANNNSGSGSQMEHNLYLMGYLSYGVGTYAFVWKNGMLTKMNDSSLNYGFGNAMTIVDTNIFVCGDIYTIGNNAIDAPTIWTNGIPSQTSQQKPNLGGSSLYGEYFAITSYGNDIYVGGDWLYRVPTDSRESAVFWKNGVPTSFVYKNAVIPNDFDSSEKTSIRTMYVSGSDIYAGGYISGMSKVNGLNVYGCYWKNGQITVLFPGVANGALVNGIAVLGNDVYAVGVVTFPQVQISGQQYSSLRPRAYLWKNGNPALLYDSTQSSEATSIQIANGNIYISGYVGNNQNTNTACYWKNGVQVILGDGFVSSAANAICISGNDIYVAGEVRKQDGITYGAYWKNGVATILSVSGTVVFELYGIYYK